MRLKLFRAPDMQSAMAQLREELGPEALILSTRRVADGIEVSAALEPGNDPPLSIPPEPDRPPPLGWHGAGPTLTAALAGPDLAAALAKRLTFGSLSLGPDAPPLLLAGPPGAGKTLTTARLATRLVLAGITPTVITADARRAGSAEQLAAFTRLLGLPLIAAGEPVLLARCLARPRAPGPVLIDGPGLDIFDGDDRTTLLALAAGAAATVALVLPAGIDVAEATDIAEAYRDVGVTHLIATRLDLARRLGSVLASAATGLVLTEAGIGPGAADGLVPLTPRLLADRLASSLPAKMLNQRNAA